MIETAIPQLLEQAVAHDRAGRRADAEILYRQVLSIEPNQPDALHLLGVLAFKSGQPALAIDLIGRAVAANPAAAEYWTNLASILNHQKRFDQAGTACAQALRIRPDHADAYYQLALALRGKNEPDRAVTALNEAISFQPQFPEAFNTLGNILLGKSRIEDAVAAYRQAITQRPTFAEGHANLGAALQNAGRLEEAIAAYEHAIRLQPNSPEAFSNLGHVLLVLGRPDDAIAACRRAIDLRPTDAAARNNLGNALQAKGQPDEASAAYIKALSLRHNYPKAWNNLGNVQFSQGMLDEAIASFEHAAQLSPQDPTAHSNKVYALHFHPHYDADSILRELKIWHQRRAQQLTPSIRSFSNDRTPTRRLRIGYVSPDFRQHVVGYNMLPVMERHDRSQFEIFCYSNVAHPDEMTDAFRSHADTWRNIVGLSDEGVARLIREDQIDVLVDLALHMAGGRLLVFARKPAPVQVTFAGYPGGTGVEAIDYRLTDPHLDPPVAREANYVEQSIILPDSFWCYDPRDTEPAVNDLPASSNGYVTFGCFNNFTKVNGDVIDLWAKVLMAVPNSRLLVMAAEGSHRERFVSSMTAVGVAGDRIEFVDRHPRRQYLALYHRVDIGLDTFPYNGHTTSLDSIWMGVPVVTLVGQTAVGRAGWSQLSNLNLTELAALDQKQFVQIAVDLATHLPRLAELRGTLRRRLEQSPLMDAAGFTRNIEASFRQMWRAWAMA